MSKRKPLTFDSNQLAEDLKESTGKGVDAFFSSPSQSPNRDIQRPHSPKPSAKKKKINWQCLPELQSRAGAISN